MPKPVEFHLHARERLVERGVTEEEIIATVANGEQGPAKFGRTLFRRNFVFDSIWRGRRYGTKQVEVFAVDEGDHWLVITVIAKYF
jgi:hypothetical protein